MSLTQKLHVMFKKFDWRIRILKRVLCENYGFEYVNINPRWVWIFLIFITYHQNQTSWYITILEHQDLAYSVRGLYLYVMLNLRVVLNFLWSWMWAQHILHSSLEYGQHFEDGLILSSDRGSSGSTSLDRFKGNQATPTWIKLGWLEQHLLSLKCLYGVLHDLQRFEQNKRKSSLICEWNGLKATFESSLC